jgi:tight adherence protein B
MTLSLIFGLGFTSILLAAVWALNTRRRPAGSGPDQEATPPERLTAPLERLARLAGLSWTGSTFLTFALAGLLLAGLFALLGQNLAALAAAVAGIFGPTWYVLRLREARNATILRQLPQALFLSASVLRAGGALLQAVDAVATELPAPLGEEFRRVREELLLGVPAYQAMAHAQDRIQQREFAAMVVAVRITAELGGNLAHIFDQIARSVVDSQNARRTLQAFTTEGRTSANLIAALPFAVMGAMQLLNPGYFQPLFTTAVGLAILITCVALIFIGWRIVRRMVQIRPY